jgi:three-Cys-motif partner protein
MTSRTKHFTAFGDHTLLKHAILQAYLQAWGFKLLGWGAAGDAVFFVDGFAGAGQDKNRNPGSPIIACRIAQQVRAHFAKLGRVVRMGVIAVESNRSNHELLSRLAEPFDRVDSGSVLVLLGSVSDHMDEIVRDTGARPTLFFLDPFGVKGLNAATYPTMLAGDHNEILALFSDIGAVRLRGLVHADAGVEHQIEALRVSPSLFPEFDARAAQDLEVKAVRKRRQLARFGAAAREAISSALGESSWVEELRDLTSQEARTEIMIRFLRKLAASGAKYLMVVPMSGATGKHKYCLVHASKSLKGYTAMKEAVSQSLNRSDLAPDMRNRVRQDLRMPLQEVLLAVRTRFGGRTVRWSGESGVAESVKRFLLEDTAVFNFQCSEIKRALKEHGWLRTIDRVEQCVLPND